MKAKSISFFNNNEELLDYATTRIDNNYLVLLKGSHSSLIDVIADGLKKN
jgi:UDP-N-acetylmuramyl pentapeptide synthase